MSRSIAERFCAVNIAWLAGPIVLLALAAAPAHAHPEFAPQTVNRYIKFDLIAPDAVRLAYTVMVGAAPAAAARAQADTNHDGKLDDNEQRALGDRLRRAVAAGVTLTVDGKKIEPVFDAPAVGLAGDAVGASPFSIDLVTTLPCPGAAPHSITFDDAPADPMSGETEIRVEEAPATRLISAHRGPSGSERQMRFLFSGPKFSALEDRSIGFTFAAAGSIAKTDVPVKQPESAVLRRYVIFGSLGLLALGAIVLAMLRRQRNMKG